MNILFLTLVKMESLEHRGIYHDLMREFSKNDHQLYIVSPSERRDKQSTSIKKEKNAYLLNVKTLNIQKTNFVEKGFSTLTVEKFFLKAIKKFFKDVKFDLVIYSTPPITFTNLIKYIKKRDNAKSYLLLKDIFPQNAVDMKMLSEKSFLFRYFRKKEKELYHISDKIGCMSQANVDFLLKYNSEIAKDKTEINPNSIEVKNHIQPSVKQKNIIRFKFGIPQDRKIFIYGGNLGKPQGIDFLVETLDAIKNNNNIFFVIVGSGTEHGKIRNWMEDNRPNNILLLSALPKTEYDELVRCCDVGLIFLHKDFKIPNYPSRLLSYLEYKMPVLAATDQNTDVGTDLTKNGCGIAVYSGDVKAMVLAINKFVSMSDDDFEKMRENSFRFLENEFKVSSSYDKIIYSINSNKITS